MDIAVVTGAAGNVGRAVAEALAAQGLSLALVDRSEDLLAATFGEPSPERRFVAVDLLDAAGTAAGLAAAADRGGRIAVLCNVAGGFEMGEPVHAASDATWDLMFDLNLRTMLNASRAVVPSMIDAGGGRIVNVAAASARRGAALMGPYCAAKSSVISLTESMSAELRDRGINVNCVLPGIVDTPQNRKAMPDADHARWVAPRDLAAVIAFLASPAARAVHGAAVPVTGRT